MADVTNFKIGSNTYLVKDETARNGVDKLNNGLSDVRRNIKIIPDFKNTILLGDSYGTGYTPEGIVSSWIDDLIPILPGVEKSYKMAEGGIGFSHANSANSKTAIMLWNELKDNVSWLADATAVIIMLGINDSDQTAANVTNAAKTLFDRIHADCPNAIIYYFFSTNYTIYKRSICEACYDAAYSKNFVRCYESAWWMLLQDSLFASDFKHPNVYGHQEIARKMLNALSGAKITNMVYLDISDVDGVTVNVFVTNDTVRLYISGAIKASRSTTLGHFPSKFFYNDEPFGLITQELAGLLGSGTTFVGSVAVAYGGSVFKRVIYAIHIGNDLTTGSLRYSKTFNVYSFFGE